MKVKQLTLNTSTKDLYMVGPTYAKRLEKLNIQTAEDFLHHYPSRYHNLSLISKIANLQSGETATIQGVIINCQNVYTKRGKKIQKAIISDGSGQIEAVWFNQPFLTKTLKKGAYVSLAGRVDHFGPQINLVSPEYEALSTKPRGLVDTREYGLATKPRGLVATIHTGRLVPVYPETYGVSSKWLRSRIAPLLKKLLPQIKDWLPATIKQEQQLINLPTALKQIHFPANKKEITQAKKRLSFDELFLIQLAALKRKGEWQKNKATQSFRWQKKDLQQFITQLPFKLTAAQKRAAREILQDLKKTKPMNRLLEGDVGSGKTVVAAMAIYLASLNQLQSALMAPTEILSLQHYQTIKELLRPFGLKISLLTSSKKVRTAKKELQEADLLIGTHALIYQQTKLEKLGLVVIDEQHRFGVGQRAKLIQKGQAPHLLTMTATPIPRTIALTLYGDLDLSVLDELPPGRKRVKTWIVPPQKRQSAYQWIKDQIKEKKCQAFIVCPLVELSEKESMKDIRAAQAEFQRLEEKVFPQFKLGLLHGRLKSQAKEKVIQAFRKGKLDILVATPVVEVGIDIPRATIMVIEDSQRFGLAQLHQLRGRVGRSPEQAYCLLFAAKKGDKGLKRLEAMRRYNSGFKLAEIDLKLRGPGELYGLKQHGFLQLKIASFSDAQLIQQARQSAQKIIGQLTNYPLLKKRLEKDTIKTVKPN